MSTPAGEGQQSAEGQATGVTMNSETGLPQGQTPVTPTVVPPQAQQQVQTPTAPQTPAQPGDGLPDDAAALKAEILRLRQENASSRTNAKAQAAEDAKKELAQQIGKALGIVEDEVDPAKLTEQLTAAKASQTEAARELAVFKAAGQHGADPAKLLDSRSFLASIKDTDPTDAAAIAGLVKVAVDANPAFKLAQAAGASSVDHAGGSGEGAVTPEQFKAMGYAERVQLYQTNRALYDQLAGVAG